MLLFLLLLLFLNLSDPTNLILHTWPLTQWYSRRHTFNIACLITGGYRQTFLDNKSAVLTM